MHYAIHTLYMFILNSGLSFTGSKQKVWSERAKFSFSRELRATDTTC